MDADPFAFLDQNKQRSNVCIYTFDKKNSNVGARGNIFAALYCNRKTSWAICTLQTIKSRTWDHRPQRDIMKNGWCRTLLQKDRTSVQEPQTVVHPYCFDAKYNQPCNVRVCPFARMYSHFWGTWYACCNNNRMASCCDVLQLQRQMQLYILIAVDVLIAVVHSLLCPFTRMNSNVWGTWYACCNDNRMA